MSLSSMLNLNENEEDDLIPLPNLSLQQLTLQSNWAEDLPNPSLNNAFLPWETEGELDWGQPMDFSQQPDDSQRLNGVYEDSPPSSSSASRQNSEEDSLPDAPPMSSQDSITDDPASADNEEKICYGMIYRSDVKLVGEMARINSKLTENEQEIHALSLRFGPDRVFVDFDDGNQFGYLRENMTTALKPLRTIKSLEFEVILIAQTLRKQIGNMKKASDAVIPVDINVYGPRSLADDVGELLSIGKAFLQRPDHHRRRFPYENPHVIKFTDADAPDPIHDVQQQNATNSQPKSAAEKLQDVVSQVHRSLHRSENLQRAEGDQRLKTTLLDHQKQGLTFMLQRESGDIPDEFRLWKQARIESEEWFLHRITKTKDKVRPEEKGGGILADEMGMGKSLAILAIITATLKDADEWAEKQNSNKSPHVHIETYSHGTLVIVPSALLINSWLNEIDLHLDNEDETLHIVKYHGAGRKQDLESLAKSDIIITTYHTLAAEFATKDSPVHKIGWYRVVLDEAHTIRRPATTFYRTCVEIDARSRWCLTGTPIQNRLEDIGALFAFLRADPFHNLANFRKHIVVPFEQGDETIVERLRLLYDSLVLRRTKDVLSLPGQEERIRKLDLSPEERKQYERTVGVLDRNIRNLVGAHEIPGKFGLFQATMQLRIFCNHGTYQKMFSWKQRKLAEEDENESFLAELGLDLEAKCVTCHQPRPILGSNMVYNKFVEKCNHMLCAECLEADGDKDTIHCPLCNLMANTIGNGNTARAENDDGSGDVEMVDQAPALLADHEKAQKHYFNKVGKSTKMDALVEDVQRDLQTTKSIIFSCWTKTLDLVERKLKENNIESLRIDGDSPLSQRQNTLDQFAKASCPQRVMLMTTGTGAFGLNLTAANRIFIVELQWNPSVENQAIARAIRLRQSEKVIVTRYIMKKTVEEEMQSQQINKRRAANAGFESSEHEN